jgi:hypothetical protein
MCTTRAAILPLGVSSILLASAAIGAELRLDPELARNPPRVARATIELMQNPAPNANAIVRVQFRQRPASNRIVVRNGEALTLLRDDGQSPDQNARDGMYAGLVRINTGQYTIEQRRRLRLAETFREVPVIEQRRSIGLKPFRPSTVVQLAPGVRNVIDDFQGLPYPVDPDRELVIKDVSVVEDKKRTYDACTGQGKRMGAWTFGRLITEMANQTQTGIHPGDFAEHWFNEWLEDQTINSFDVANAAAGAQLLLDQWPRLPSGQLNVAKAPFRLLAIVNRLDLRESALFSKTPGAGELRFVFGFLNCENDATLGAEAMEGTVILEYGVNRHSCFGIRDWARKWQHLGTLVLGSTQYRTALQELTDEVALADANPAQLPNRSAINQVRTNEIAFLHDGWQLRESKLCSAKKPCLGQLENMTVAQTPDLSFIFTETLRSFIEEHEDALLEGSHAVPLQYPAGSPFRGGVNHQDNNWDVPEPFNEDAVAAFSLATCNGCHDMGDNFQHIVNRDAGVAASISDFLADDLLHRQMHLDATANMTCQLVGDFALEELFISRLPPAFVH